MSKNYILKSHPINTIDYIITNALFLFQLVTDYVSNTNHSLFKDIQHNLNNDKLSGLITAEFKYNLLLFWINVPEFLLINIIDKGLSFLCTQYFTHRLYGRYNQIQIFEQCDDFVNSITPVLLVNEELLLVFLNNNLFLNIFNQNIYYLWNIKNLSVHTNFKENDRETFADSDDDNEDENEMYKTNIIEKNIIHKANLNKRYYTEVDNVNNNNRTTMTDCNRIMSAGFFMGKSDELYSFQNEEIENTAQQLPINISQFNCLNNRKQKPKNDYETAILNIFGKEYKNISILLTLLFYLDHGLQSIYELNSSNNKNLDLITICKLYSKVKLVPHKGFVNNNKISIEHDVDITMENLILNANVL